MASVDCTSSSLIELWALKRKRKKGQGFAKRYFVLHENGLLTYSTKPHGQIRETCDMNRAIVGRSPAQKEVVVDTGVSTWTIRFLNQDDYQKWLESIRNFRTQVAERRHSAQLSRLSSSQMLRPELDTRFVLTALQNLEGPIKRLEELHHIKRRELSDLSITQGSSASSTHSSAKLRSIFGSKKGKDATTLDAPTHFDAQRLDQVTDTLIALRTQYDSLVTAIKDRDLAYNTWTSSPTQLPMQQYPMSARSEDDDSIYHDASLADDYDLDQAAADDDGPVLSSIPEDNDAVDDDDGESPSEGTDTEAGAVAIKRRSNLPAGVSGEETSIFGLLRKNLGKDLTKITFPISFNEPLSALQRWAEEFEYAHLLRSAATCQDPIDRICLVAAFIISGYASAKHRKTRKPFNPLLGETFECIRPDKGISFVAEKVQHHPSPVLAAVVSDTDGSWTFCGDRGGKEKFYGKSLEVASVGHDTLSFKDFGETYTWTRPTTYIRNLLGGDKYIEFLGYLVIESESARVELEFKESGGGFWGNPAARNKLAGQVMDAHGNVQCQLGGRWDESLARTIGDGRDWRMLWESKDVDEPLPYGFSKFTVELNEITPDIAPLLPPTDSRLRPDQRELENGHVDLAERLKTALEQRQRTRRPQLEAQHLVPRWFSKNDNGEWKYHGGYYEARKAHQWNDQLEIFAIEA